MPLNNTEVAVCAHVLLTLTHSCNACVCLWQNVHLWLGGMFIPEAYITATRQYVAQANSWSLEELSLEVDTAFIWQLFALSMNVKQ